MKRRTRQPMPAEFKELADYNTRVSEGIVHTAEYDQRMAALQEQFNDWVRATAAGDP